MTHVPGLREHKRCWFTHDTQLNFWFPSAADTVSESTFLNEESVFLKYKAHNDEVMTASSSKGFTEMNGNISKVPIYIHHQGDLQLAESP